MHLELRHTTTYHYSEPVKQGLHQIRLVPRTSPGQKIERWSVSVRGATREVSYRDQFDNFTELVSLDEGEELEIEVEGSVTTVDLAGIRGRHFASMPLAVYKRSTPLTIPGPLVGRLVDRVQSAVKTSLIDQLHGLSALIADSVVYQTGITGVDTTAEQAIAAENGVCQDHAHVFVSAARSLGVPARYVSGYLMMEDQIDQAASHAWAEAYINDIGWVGFDVSNQISPDERYVVLANGLDYRDAAPVSGTRAGGGDETMTVSLSVEQVAGLEKVEPVVGVGESPDVGKGAGGGASQQ